MIGGTLTGLNILKYCLYYNFLPDRRDDKKLLIDRAIHFRTEGDVLYALRHEISSSRCRRISKSNKLFSTFAVHALWAG